MRVLSLEADGFRNLSEIRMQPDPDMNLIFGNNAQGKTNLLEAIWSCTGCRSFRGAKEKDFIRLKAPAMHLKLRFRDSRREQEIRLHLEVPGEAHMARLKAVAEAQGVQAQIGG